jgi:hypothetical protein
MRARQVAGSGPLFTGYQGSGIVKKIRISKTGIMVTALLLFGKA